MAKQPAFGSSAGELEVRTIARGLVNPWALAFLPDGTMLVTERPGRMRIVTAEGQVSSPLKGVPEVWASGQGGLLDVIIDKSFAQNRTIYFCFAERTEGGGRTTIARAKLNDGNGRLDEVKIIFRQQGPLSSGNHYGCRIAQADDGNLFVALGDHFTYRDQAQKSRQSSRQDRSVSRLTVRYPQAIRSPAAPMPSRRSGATAIAIRSRSRSIPPPANSGKSSTARAAATRSI